MSLSSPVSLIPVAVIVGFVAWAVWIQVRTRRREKRAIEASKRPTGPSGADPMASNQNESGLIANKHIVRSTLGGGWRGNGYNSP